MVVSGRHAGVGVGKNLASNLRSKGKKIALSPIFYKSHFLILVASVNIVTATTVNADVMASVTADVAAAIITIVVVVVTAIATDDAAIATAAVSLITVTAATAAIAAATAGGSMTECVFLYSSVVQFCVQFKMADGNQLAIRVFREGFPYFKYC